MFVQKIGRKYDIALEKTGDYLLHEQQREFIEKLAGADLNIYTQHWAVPASEENRKALAAAQERFPILGSLADFSRPQVKRATKKSVDRGKGVEI